MEETQERRSSRKRERTFTVSDNIAQGLREFVELNQDEVARMLDVDGETDQSTLVDRLVGIMGQQNLTPSTLLGRFFSADSLGKYCEKKGKSSKGGTATLAARVAGIWEKSQPTKATKANVENKPKTKEQAEKKESVIPSVAELPSDLDAGKDST
jgi:hypothetical protein